MVIASASTSGPQRVLEEGMFPDYVQRCCPNLSNLGRFPRALNRHDGCMQHLEVSADNSTVTYTGRGRDDTEAAAIRADAPIPPLHLPLFYFEIKVESKGRDGYMSVGIMTARSPLDKLVGWETESLGYHGDDGLLFRGNSGHGSEFGPEWGQGDIIGCGVDFVDQRAFFVKNGVIVNYCELPKVGNSPWYPGVGLRTLGEKVRLNFLGPFDYDIMAHLSRKTFKLTCAISQERHVDDVQVQDLLLFYLLYHGYEQTFYKFVENNCHEPLKTKLAKSANLRLYFEEKKVQREVFRLIDAGEIGHLKTLLETSFPHIILIPTVQLVLTGVDLLELAFTPGHDLKNLIAKATELQLCFSKNHKSGASSEYQSFFEVLFHLIVCRKLFQFWLSRIRGIIPL